MFYDAWSERDTVLGAGLLVFVSYLGLNLAFGNHELAAFDIYSYISFAEGYAQNWFHTVYPGAAHGLETVSYPPLVFHVMAVLGLLLPLSYTHIAILLISLGAAGVSVATYVLFKTVTGIDHPRGYLIILFVAFSPGLLKFVLVHGQLPLMIGSTFGLLAAALFYRVLEGRQEGVFLAAALALTAYTHHFSFLLMVLMMGIIAVLNVEKVVRRIEYLLPVFLVSGGIAVIGLYPAAQEMLFGVSQGRIFHGSRNPLAAADVFHQFLSTTYGVTVLGILLLFKDRVTTFTVNMITLVFLMLGIGLVTPVPEAVFGGVADFIVYDRFSLVASLFLAALIGAYSLDLPRTLRSFEAPTTEIVVIVFILLGIWTTVFANTVHHGDATGYIQYNDTQTQTALTYLETNASDDYLYMTRGHGPPVGELERRTDVPTLDTPYYPGRKLGFLEAAGRFDRIPDENLTIILRNAENLSLKYVFAFDGRSNAVMEAAGWEQTRIGPGVDVWTNPDPVPPYEPDYGERRVLFGVMPGLTLLLAAGLLVFPRLRRNGGAVLERLQRSVARAADRRIGRPWLWIIAVPVVAAAPSLVTGGAYPAGIDTPAHIFKVELLQSMIAEHGRMFYWTNAWYAGYPFLSMYPPVSMYVLYGMNLLLGDITLTFNLFRLLTLALLAAAMYALSLRVFEDRRVSLMVVVLTVFSYPLYANLFTVGRVASAAALPIYVFLIHLLLRDDVFQTKVSRAHVLIGISAGVLFLAHAMMAYLFLYTGLIFLVVYRDRVPDIGVKPLTAAVIPAIALSLPYLRRLLHHSRITDSAWFIVEGQFQLIGHVARDFTTVMPNYQGIVQVAFMAVGLAKYSRLRDKFLQFSVVNAAFFFLLFWVRNYRSTFIPLFGKFDQARFEILLTIFAIFIAGYGLKYLLDQGLPGASSRQKKIFLVLLAVIVMVDASPMLSQSANWSPEFASEMDALQLEEYRAIGINMRQWGSYLLPEMGVSPVYGWFLQGNPNPTFTNSLQNQGGVWYAWDRSDAITHRDPRILKNLMELSNTRYIVYARGEWLPESRKRQVKGWEPNDFRPNRQFAKMLSDDQDFQELNRSEHLSVYRLEREMSYCEPADPVWISDSYLANAATVLLQEKMLPTVPVKGDPVERTTGTVAVECDKPDPYTITLDVDGAGWVLVKESHYPYWKRSDGGAIHDAFGFMVLHVEDDTELVYNPPER